MDDSSDRGMEASGFRKVGIASPGAPCGDIWVSDAAIYQKGEAEVRRFVRETFRAAYDARRRPCAAAEIGKAIPCEEDAR